MITVNNDRIFIFWSTISLRPDLWVKNRNSLINLKDPTHCNLSRWRELIWMSRFSVNEWQPLKCVHGHQVSKSTVLQNLKHPTIPHQLSEGSGLSPSEAMFCSSPKQHESSWRQLAVWKEASHIHSAAVPSANSAAKQKNKQQLEGLRRLKVLAWAPLARLWRDLRSVCQSSSTRKSQTFMHTSVFEKGEWKHLDCVNWSVFSSPPVSFCFSILLISSAFISTLTQPAFSQPHDWHSFSQLLHFSQALSGSSSTTHLLQPYNQIFI